MSIKTIIFDVDGVVFNSQDQSGSYIWLQSIEQDLGITKSHLQILFSPEWENVTKGQINLIDYLKDVFSSTGFSRLNITPEKYIEYWLAKDNNLNHDMLELVKSLKVPSYLGTNQEFHRTRHIGNLIGKYFSGIFPSYKINYIKPDLEFFQYIENSLKLTPQELLLIDDCPKNIKGAKNKGWHVYHYKDNLNDLQNYLEKYR
jgi:HAD superfamily hydrolase (TIGR01509 family)